MENSTVSKQGGWSWGGFMFSPVVILGSKRYVYLLLYLLGIIPLVGPLLWIAVMIFMGVKGRALVMASGVFSDEEARGFMKGIDHAGKIMFWIMIVLVIVGIIFGLVAGASLFGLLGGLTSGGLPDSLPVESLQY